MKLFGNDCGRNVNAYGIFFREDLVKLQSKGFVFFLSDRSYSKLSVPPRNFPRTPRSFIFKSCQVYHTNKLVLRPTSYEEPFRFFRLTKYAVRELRKNEPALKKLITMDDLETKLESLQYQPSGLRVETVVSIELSPTVKEITRKLVGVFRV